MLRFVRQDHAPRGSCLRGFCEDWQLPMCMWRRSLRTRVMCHDPRDAANRRLAGAVSQGTEGISGRQAAHSQSTREACGPVQAAGPSTRLRRTASQGEMTRGGIVF
jgi:hypothetical protein